jgi:hypothetical protein
MSKKIFLTILTILFIICCYSVTFATNMMNDTKNTVMKAGNSIGNSIVKAKDSVVGGAKNLTNDVEKMGTGAIDTAKDTTYSAIDGGSMMQTTQYDATRTSADSNLLGMDSMAWSWIIMSIVGIVIVALVWYYGAQYEHRDYHSNE